MFKHRLMLSAATVALLAAPALAANPDEISTATTTPLKTSTANSGAPGDILIDASGSITSTTIPLITIDSSNSVTNAGSLVSKDTTGAEAFQIVSPAGSGTIADTGTIDLTGKGATKRAVEFVSGTYTSISLGGTTTITGDNSIGILIDSPAVLTGDLVNTGTMSLTGTTPGATAASGLTAIDILGTVNGNILNSGAISATGDGAQGIVVAGSAHILGTLQNTGTILATGAATVNAKSANPEGGSALQVNASVAQGIINGGDATVTLPQLLSTGLGPTVSIAAPGTSDITIGSVAIPIFADNANNPNGGYGFVNQGKILASPIDFNQTVTITGVSIGGLSTTNSTIINGGFLNTGNIAAVSASVLDGVLPTAGPTAVAVRFGNLSSTPSLDNISTATSSASILANVNGPANGGVATGVLFQAGANVPVINNLNGALIQASATATDTSTTALSAFAIQDLSGKLTTINNSGTISVLISPLNNNQQNNIAIDVRTNTSGVAINDGGVFMNNLTGQPDVAKTGTITGQILFGSGNDTLAITGVNGLSGGGSTVAGAVDFGSSASITTFDTLTLKNFATITGAVQSAQGYLNISATNSSNFLLNNATLLAPTNLKVASLTVDASSVFNVTVAQNLGGPAVQAINTGAATGVIDIESTSNNFAVKFGGFLTSNDPLVVLDAQSGKLILPNVNDYITDFTTPFLFTGGLCTNNVAGPTTTCASGVGNNTRSQLVLDVVQKTATDLQLTGYAKTMYNLANAVLPLDTQLGSAVLTGVTSNLTAQQVYDQFAPTATGAARAIAISLTDQATGTVGARQRQLRQYGKQAGDSTLWGIEYAQFLKDPGQTIPAVASTPAAPTDHPAGLLSGYKDHGFGFAIGGDGGSAKNGWYGGALTFYTGDAGELGNRSGNTQSEWYMATGYTDWRGRGLFFDSNLNVGLAQFKGKRIINIDDSTGTSLITRTAENKHTGLLLGGGVTTGAMLNYGGTTFTPQLSLDALTMREEAYTENGGSTPGSDAVDLAVKPSYGNSLRAFLGTDLRQDIDVGDFFLQPAARVGYRYDFVKGAQKVNASFVGDGSIGTTTPFSVLGPDPARGNFVAGVSMGATTDTWSLNVSYDMVRGTNGAMQQDGQFTLVGRI